MKRKLPELKKGNFLPEGEQPLQLGRHAELSLEERLFSQPPNSGMGGKGIFGFMTRVGKTEKSGFVVSSLLV